MRFGAGVIGVAALATLITRIFLKMDADDIGLVSAVWELLRYFTIWTNLLIGLFGCWTALGGRAPQWVAACLALSIVVVAGVYHVLLAHLNDFVGIDLVIDHMFHSVIPAAFVVLWLFALPKAQLLFSDMVWFMAYPFIYCVYALGRGAVDATYPYGFLNVTNLGAGGVAVNVAGLVVVFGLGGLALIAIGKMAARR